jgi:hypothetical protein
LSPAAAPAALCAEALSRSDIAFCEELALHGGVAVSAEGFKAEAELIRLHRAGLIELLRETQPPFAIVRVALTPAARQLGDAPSETADASPIVPSPSAAPQTELGWRRNGFEVARGMISAAVKAELAAWVAAGCPGGVAQAETRVMTRISQLAAPFLP